MQHTDFDPGAVQQVIGTMLDELCQVFQNTANWTVACRHLGIPTLRNIEDNIFQVPFASGRSLFRILLESYTASEFVVHPTPRQWNLMAPFFCQYDATIFYNTYFHNAAAALVNFQMCVTALPGAIRGPKWQRFLDAALHAAGILHPLLPPNALEPLNSPSYNAIFNINIHAYAITDITSCGMWVTTEKIRQIPGVGFAKAMNFLRDAGCQHAFKPDIHTKRILHQAFFPTPATLGLPGANRPTHTLGIYADDAICDLYYFQMALAFVQSANQLIIPGWNGSFYNFTLASFDRLLWSASSGKLPLLTNGRILTAAARTNLSNSFAAHLRSTILPGRL